MRPSSAETIPPEHGLPGGVQYSVKLDGIRCAAFTLPSQPVLQSRGGHNRAHDFPTIAAAVARLPAGTVLDGELCAWNTAEQRFEFEALLRSRRAREASEVAVSYVVFDLLAAPEDLRELPLSRRWELLQNLLSETGPPLQTVMATTDRALAGEWFDALVPLGVEGLVCRGLATRYRAGDRRAWFKIRHTDTVDVFVVAITGTPRRPRTALLQLLDGRRLETPKLDAVHARQIGDALAAQDPPRPDTAAPGLLLFSVPLAAEARLGTSRHPTVRFVRVKADQDPVTP